MKLRPITSRSQGNAIVLICPTALCNCNKKDESSTQENSPRDGTVHTQVPAPPSLLGIHTQFVHEFSPKKGLVRDHDDQGINLSLQRHAQDMLGGAPDAEGPVAT